MRAYRLFIVVLLLMLAFTLGSVIAQDEATEEAEATDVVEETEMTEEAEATEPAAEETEETPSDGSTYVVQRGDNLFRIALRYGLTPTELAQANNIANPSLIFVGQVLTIPGGGDGEEPVATEEPETTVTPTATATPNTGSGDTSSYVVQPGDSLFRIAVSNSTTVATLLSLNPSIANPNLIFVGQSINLPGGAADEGDNDADDGDADDGDADSGEALDVVMMSGVEVLMGDDPIANASLVTQLGVDWVKITVDWAAIEAEEGVFDFTALDAAVSAFESAGTDIMLTLTGAPDWSRPSATDLALEQPTYGPPDDLDTFGTFAGEVASHYAGRVAAYEIWYQPNNRLSWMTTDVELRSDGFPDAHLSDVRYIDLLEVAYEAIKAADADALVVTAGLAPTGNNDFYNSIDNFVFFEELVKQGAANFSDGFGVHIDGFGNAPDATCCGESNQDPEFDESYHFFFADTLDNFREILDRNGGASVPLWVTRFGWGTNEGAAADGSEMSFVTLNTAQEQADYTLGAFEAADARGDIGAMILYNLNGCALGNTSACYYSLIDNSGNARVAFSAVAGFDGGGDE